MRHISGGRGSQKRILMILNEAQCMTQRELTERLGIQPGSACEVIGKLEAAGFLVRTPSETDRKATLSLRTACSAIGSPRFLWRDARSFFQSK